MLKLLKSYISRLNSFNDVLVSTYCNKCKYDKQIEPYVCGKCELVPNKFERS